jgi:hypothetical protein
MNSKSNSEPARSAENKKGAGSAGALSLSSIVE